MRPVHGYRGKVAVALPAVRSLYQAVHGMKDRLRSMLGLDAVVPVVLIAAAVLMTLQPKIFGVEITVERGLALTRAAAAMLIVLR
jgi:hypothetical protein